ncbi:DUF5318 family protein [Corynebacterium breve]|uniref:DUF5318 family protein n=1 Tax=Corynebacterium breve TaxID=3049799 RepID=A0ABY8VD56_9CORY|nr:DUF5318 family protein [Corynebacterium breve]WIM67590.1 DUF5318 family protein [Corynebacterium breve]
MLFYGQHVSHEWERRNLLRNFAAGRIKRADICDADFLLVTASEYHGEPSRRPCPVCEKTMNNVRWIYGEQLGRRSGTARSAEEIETIAAEAGPITVHRVEVCPHCRWNHLLEESVAQWHPGPGNNTEEKY